MNYLEKRELFKKRIEDLIGGNPPYTREQLLAHKINTAPRRYNYKEFPLRFWQRTFLQKLLFWKVATKVCLVNIPYGHPEYETAEFEEAMFVPAEPSTICIDKEQSK